MFYLRNEGLYHEHPDREQEVNREVNLDDRIKEILDITSKPLNFEMVFSMNTVISCKELLLHQKRDRFCRKLVRTIGRHSDFMVNHEGLLVKQVSILRSTYRVYIVPHYLVQRVIKIFHNNRGHQGISRTINMIKRRFWFGKMREQVNMYVNKCLLCCQHVTHKVKYESKHLPIPDKPFDGICLDCIGRLERSK